MKVIISSCAKYSGVRSAVFDSIYKHLPSSKIYCFTSSDDASLLPSEVSLLKGQDEGWSSNLSTLLRYFQFQDDENVLLWMDDLLLVKSPPHEYLDLVSNDFNRLGLHCLSLYQPAPAKCVSSVFADAGLYSAAGKHYPVSCMASIINVGFLRNLLFPGETAWDFEKKASRRIPLHEQNRCMVTNCNMFDIANLVVRGELVGWRTNGLSFDSLHEMGMSSRTKYRAKMLIHFIKMLEPSFFKKILS